MNNDNGNLDDQMQLSIYASWVNINNYLSLEIPRKRSGHHKRFVFENETESIQLDRRISN